MVTTPDVYGMARQDPVLKGIGCILPEDVPFIKSSLRSHPGAAYISEWNYRGNTVVYVHSKVLGEQLKRQLASGPRPRHPILLVSTMCRN